MSDIKKTTLHVYDESTKTFKIVHPETETSQIPDLDTYIEKAMAANDAKEQQVDWNITDTTSKTFIKNKPENLINIGNSPKFDLVSFYKEDNSGHPNYFLMHELVQYNPDKLTYPISAVYGFNGMVFGEPRIGNDGNQFLVFAKIDLGYEDISLYSSSTHYSPVVLKDETNNKYYWAMRINGSYQRVYMLGTFTAPPLKTAILSVDMAGNLPEGWSLVHTAMPYPLDNTSVFKAERDANGDKIDTTYEKITDASSVHESLQNSINSLSTGKQDKLTFDTTPIADSANPVTSGGVKTALDGKLSLSGGTVTGTVNLKNGLTSTGAIQVNPNTTYYNEDIRLNESTAKLATIYMGAPLNSTSGANENAWGISRRPDGKLDFFKNGSGSTLSTGLRLNGDGTALLGGKEVVKNTGTWGISITGNANTATKLQTTRTISLTGNATGSANFDGSGNVSINTTVSQAAVVFSHRKWPPRTLCRIF